MSKTGIWIEYKNTSTAIREARANRGTGQPAPLFYVEEIGAPDDPSASTEATFVLFFGPAGVLPGEHVTAGHIASYQALANPREYVVIIEGDPGHFWEIVWTRAVGETMRLRLRRISTLRHLQ
jgi:hypothetical protein